MTRKISKNEFLSRNKPTFGKKNSKSYLFEKEKSRKTPKTFFFTFKLLYFSKDYLEFELEGRHYPRNAINSFSRAEVKKYKKAIHDAVYILFLQNKRLFSNFKSFFQYSIHYDVYNKISRDDDANLGGTLKHLRDALVNNKILVDDKRENTNRPSETEILGKEYKIIAKISKLS